MGTKLFVGSLAYSTTDERLRETFARFGPVESANVVRDRHTGRSRGFGFVEMATPDEARNAMAGADGVEPDGRRINVELAKPAGSGSGGGQHRGARGDWSGGHQSRRSA